MALRMNHREPLAVIAVDKCPQLVLDLTRPEIGGTAELPGFIDYIDRKDALYQDILSGKTPHVSNLID